MDEKAQRQRIAQLEEKLVEYEAKLAEYQAMLGVRDELIARLSRRIEELERGAKLNSSNSSKPPSSDGLKKKPVNRSLRETSDKPGGGQVGHPGTTLKQVAMPDRIEVHAVEACPHCGTDLRAAAASQLKKRQVFELPQPRVEVTEHQAQVKRCTCCGQEVTAAFPAGVHAPAQYGERVKALADYLLNQQLIPEDRLQVLMNDVFGLPISSATLTNASQECAQRMAAVVQAIQEHLHQEPVKHLDETGMRVEGKLHWLHVTSGPYATCYRVEEKRGAMPQGIGGTVVHDHFKPYYGLDNVTHGLCGAHHLRELKSLIEIEKEAWAGQMSRLLQIVCRLSRRQRASDRHSGWIHRLYDKIVAAGLQFHEAQPALESKAARGRKKRRTGHNLLIRLRDFKGDALRCLSDPAVPFSNNLAEQDLRMMKVRQKISGGFRTKTGARMFATIRSVISTARKQGRNILQAILDPSALGYPFSVPPAPA